MASLPLLARTWTTRAVWASSVAANDIEHAVAVLEDAPLARVFRASALASVRTALGSSIIERARETSGSFYIDANGFNLVLQLDVALYADANNLDFAFAVGTPEKLRSLPSLPSPDAASVSTFLSGLRTLPVRVERQGNTARHIARCLAGHPRIASVDFPGLRTDPQHEHAVSHEFLRDEIRFVAKESAFDGQRFLKMLTLFQPQTATPSVSSCTLGRGTYILRCGLEDANELSADLLLALATLDHESP